MRRAANEGSRFRGVTTQSHAVRSQTSPLSTWHQVPICPRGCRKTALLADDGTGKSGFQTVRISHAENTHIYTLSQSPALSCANQQTGESMNECMNRARMANPRIASRLLPPQSIRAKGLSYFYRRLCLCRQHLYSHPQYHHAPPTFSYQMPIFHHFRHQQHLR